MSRLEQPIPVLLLERDHYFIETVINIGWRGWTAWILLHQDAIGRVQAVANGWGPGFHEQRRAAYEAMKQHKADLAARGGRS